MSTRHPHVVITILTMGALLGLAHTSPARAQEGDPPTALIGVRVGGFFPQVFNELSTSYLVSVGGGYVLPALDHRLAIVVDAGYTRPEREQTIEDPRLAEGSYSYTLIQHDLTFFVGGHYHFLDLRETFIPYAGLGLRVHLLKSEIDGQSGEPRFGTNEETSTQFGVPYGWAVGCAPGRASWRSRSSSRWRPSIISSPETPTSETSAPRSGTRSCCKCSAVEAEREDWHA